MLEGESNFILKSDYHHIQVGSSIIFHSEGQGHFIGAKLLKNQDKPKPAPVRSVLSAGPPSCLLATLMTVIILQV